MSAKFALRTLRSVVFRNRPYFAHLAITHRCNLRCRFCHIQESVFDELDTDGMQRVIDRLDEMGVAVLSISGGGEPLLRPDFAAIVDYAAGKGMYTKLTSNGALPLTSFCQLLQSRVKEIGISLDGIRGNDLPFSHVGPRILDSIGYLHDHLPPGKQLTINVTVTEANRGQLDEILDYCAREFPRARVWLNPVVVGTGALRTAAAAGTDPDYLRRCQSPTLLSAKFYIEGVERQSRAAHFDWGCLAGAMFFDIKPNGDFWLCQDQPPRTPLNILDPLFRRKLRAADFSSRRECAGCTFSCYYLTQNGFSPRNWQDMALLWWKSRTAHGDPCRVAADRHGWAAGLFMYLFTRVRARLQAPAAASLAILLFLAGSAVAQNPLQRDPAEVLTCMERASEERQARLQPYISDRVYRAGNPRLRRSATVVAEVQYAAGEKTFRIVSRSGSGAIQKRVIEPLLVAECKNSPAAARAQTDINSRNYDFEFVDLDPENGAYVFRVLPRTKHKYLFRGQVWIDAESCGIRRTAGEPAVSPSFWVKKTAFVQDYELIAGQWLPRRHRTEVQLRIFGRSTLEIDYLDYSRELVKLSGPDTLP